MCFFLHEYFHYQPPSFGQKTVQCNCTTNLFCIKTPIWSAAFVSWKASLKSNRQPIQWHLTLCVKCVEGERWQLTASSPAFSTGNCKKCSWLLLDDTGSVRHLHLVHYHCFLLGLQRLRPCRLNNWPMMPAHSNLVQLCNLSRSRRKTLSHPLLCVFFTIT